MKTTDEPVSSPLLSKFALIKLEAMRKIERTFWRSRRKEIAYQGLTGRALNPTETLLLDFIELYKVEIAKSSGPVQETGADEMRDRFLKIQDASEPYTLDELLLQGFTKFTRTLQGKVHEVWIKPVKGYARVAYKRED